MVDEAHRDRPQGGILMAASIVTPELTPCATPVSVDDLARLRVQEACIETLTAENEILKRRLARAEARAEEENAKAQWAIAQFLALIRGVRATGPAQSCRRAGVAGGGEG